MEQQDHHVYLADFGLSRVSAATVGSKTMTAGSPGFQSSEQLRAESVGPASDVYAFGGVLAVCYLVSSHCGLISHRFRSGSKLRWKTHSLHLTKCPPQSKLYVPSGGKETC